MNRERRGLRYHYRVLRNFRKRYLDCFFKLRIVPGDDISGRDLNVEVRNDADVFDAPRCSTRIVRGTIRKTDLSTVNQRRREVVWTNAAAESSFADEWSNLPALEHESSRP